MSVTYLIISSPNSRQFQQACQQLQTDVEHQRQISQLFFYSDGVNIGGETTYSDEMTKLLNLAEAHHIPLYICSAGFQKRQLVISDLAVEDFTFKGLGQFIVESQNTQTIRIF